jgi:hypothetical protein
MSDIMGSRLQKNMSAEMTYIMGNRLQKKRYNYMYFPYMVVKYMCVNIHPNIA